MPKITPLSEFTQSIPQNEQANLSATLPSQNPQIPMPTVALPQGVSYQELVRDKDTGEYRYVGASNPADQGAFARALQGASRRKSFGNMIIV